MTDIVTPVNVKQLNYLLKLTKYDNNKTKFLTDGFSQGFDLGYRGASYIKITSPNLKFAIGNKRILWDKMMTEVEKGRYAGPFEDIPYEHYIQSPVGLVPKDNGTKTRLIFHLSYPRNGTTSVNYNTPEESCMVKYKDLDYAVKLCIEKIKEFGKRIEFFFGKSDLTSTFRHLPMKKECWRYLVMKAQYPGDEQNKFYYFVDKCLPFGASISCKVFQAFSDGLAHIVTVLNGDENMNYLDDFLFIALLRNVCNQYLNRFLEICGEINFPVSNDKTFFAANYMEFLGLGLDGRRHLIVIPQDKLARALEVVRKMLGKNKTTIRELEQLCGYLNFLCKAVVPGRTFTR